MKYAPYSYSKLSTHKQCGRKFKYVFIDKATKNKTDMTALLKGRAVHSILENYPDKSSHKLVEKYQHIADQFIRSKLGEKYLSKDSIREFKFGLNDQLQPTSYSDKEAIFRGAIDFICTIDDVLHLCDWKTGKYKEQMWQDYDQLMFYAIYFFQRYPTINTIKISYVYVEYIDIENDLILERKHLHTYIDELMQLIKNAEEDQVFSKNESRLCEWCEFKDHCASDP